MEWRSLQEVIFQGQPSLWSLLKQIETKAKMLLKHEDHEEKSSNFIRLLIRVVRLVDTHSIGVSDEDDPVSLREEREVDVHEIFLKPVQFGPAHIIKNDLVSYSYTKWVLCCLDPL